MTSRLPHAERKQGMIRRVLIDHSSFSTSRVPFLLFFCTVDLFVEMTAIPMNLGTKVVYAAPTSSYPLRPFFILRSIILTVRRTAILTRLNRRRTLSFPRCQYLQHGSHAREGLRDARRAPRSYGCSRILRLVRDQAHGTTRCFGATIQQHRELAH